MKNRTLVRISVMATWVLTAAVVWANSHCYRQTDPPCIQKVLAAYLSMQATGPSKAPRAQRWPCAPGCESPSKKPIGLG